MSCNRPGQTLRVLFVVAMGVIASASQSHAATVKPGDNQKWAKAPALADAVLFEKDVLPILKANCMLCHGPQLKTKNMDLTTYAGVMKGSESGAVIIPGKPEESLLYKMVHEGKMPKGAKPLEKEQVETIRAWILEGAPSASQSTMVSLAPLTVHDVLPILLLRCAACHGAQHQEGGLDLRTRASMLKGGKSSPAIIPGKADESLLIKEVRSGEMPPKKRMVEAGVLPITPDETNKIAQWIAQGAPEGDVKPDGAGNGPDPLVTDKDRNFWAFQPPRCPPLPSVSHRELVRNPIDAFILSKLAEKGLSLSPEADRLTLIRRATFDLTGLPPRPEDVKAFLADRDAHAYERMIDRLLASPRYGEHWGRYWLDIAGYSDSEGGKVTDDYPRPEAWRYRDYVIRSLNADKPYERFLLEQIAGDELEDYEHAPAVTQEMMDNLIATGFLRMAPDSTNEREVNYVQDRLDVVSDEIDIFGSAVLGLTIKCAKCHSHKYDPIPQRDYYRLAAVFKGAYDYYDWLPPQNEVPGLNYRVMGRVLPYITPGATPAQLMAAEQQREASNEELNSQIAVLKVALGEKADPIRKKLQEEKLGRLPENLRDDLRKVLSTPPEKRNEVQKYLAEKFEKLLNVKPEELRRADPAYGKAAEETERQVKLLEARKIPKPEIRALWDRGDPSPTYVLRRGDPANYGELVGPGVPAVLTDAEAPFAVKPPWPGARSTGRRLALARWLTQPDNPLTARVMVNRMWDQHFGQGIVKTLGNFGHTGAPPTHPELLDWLATEFVRQGGSMKAMHRLIMVSSTYRQSSVVTPTLKKLDAENKLLSRMPMKRMQAEEVYDTMLMISGRLDETRYGVPQPVELREDGLVTPIWTEKGGRRSIYVQQRRTEIPTLLENFDLPQMGPNCLERAKSTVALQALNLMNDAMVHKLAAYFADRVAKEAGEDPQKQIVTAYWISLGRPPTEEQKRISLEGLNRIKEAEAKTLLSKATAPPKPVSKDKPGIRESAEDDPPSKTVQEEAAHLALTKFCHTLINSAAFLYID